MRLTERPVSAQGTGLEMGQLGRCSQQWPAMQWCRMDVRALGPSPGQKWEGRAGPLKKNLVNAGSDRMARSSHKCTDLKGGASWKSVFSSLGDFRSQKFGEYRLHLGSH